MKICYKNLEKLKYRPKKQNWCDINNGQVFNERICVVCGEDFLGKNVVECCSAACERASGRDKSKIEECKSNYSYDGSREMADRIRKGKMYLDLDADERLIIENLLRIFLKSLFLR